MLVLIACLIALLYTGHWLFAVLLVGVYFFRAGERSKHASEELPLNSGHGSVPSPGRFTPDAEFCGGDVYDLAVLREELERLFADGGIDRAFYDHAMGSIDTMLSMVLDGLGAVRDGELRIEGREAAWELLTRHGLAPAGPPPWHHAEQAEEVSAGTRGQQAAPLPETGGFSTGEAAAEAAGEARFIIDRPHAPGPRAKLGTAVSMPPVSAESEAMLRKVPVVPPPAAAAPVVAPVVAAVADIADLADLAPASAPRAVSDDQLQWEAPSPDSVLRPEEAGGYAWKPSMPGALEHAMGVVSGWPALIVPFLAQNIGWFIGGLCVVAGSVFLVSYTTGFAKALTVSAVLFFYTLFILWSGYQLRLRRPELETSSSVLLSLGVLLIPLNLTASVRLIDSVDHLPWIVLGVLVAAAVSAGVYFATTVVSAIMDRSLQGRHPRILLGLAGIQLAVPLLDRFPSWPLLALLHVVLLGLLAYGLVSFTRDWLHSIFVERRKIAYYAAGTFVYAALVSFVHLTWGYSHPCDLPAGYYGPFLMALCGLLFYVDAELKKWTRQYTFLSRVSFAIYGLSILALSLTFHTPAASIVTLLLAICLYGMVLWKYLTLPPLYLLLCCVSWLYGLVVLRYLPDQYHMLGSLPLVCGLFGASRLLLQRHRATTFALVCYRTWMGMAVALTGWSLLHARPGPAAMGTALAMMALLFYGLRLAPGRLFGGGEETQENQDLQDGPWLYAVTSLGTVAVAYAPRWTGLDWTAQCGFGLVVLAAVWAGLGLRLREIAPRKKPARNEVLLNSALLNLGLCLVAAFHLALPGITTSHSLTPLLAAAGGVSLWLSLKLRERWLFYCVLGLWGAAATTLKLTYFPEPGTGAVVLCAALAVWALLWWLEHEQPEVRALRREQAASAAAERPPLTLLWGLPVRSGRTYEEMLALPLERTLVVLWLLGIIQILAWLMLHLRPGWGWALSACLGALVSLLAGGRLKQYWSLSVAMLLSLGAWLTVVSRVFTVDMADLSFAAAVHALLIWRISAWVLTHPMLPRLANIFHPNVETDPARSEQYIHHTAFAVMVLGVGLSFLHYGLFVPNMVLPLTLATGSVFFWLAGKRYRRRLHSYVLLGACSVGGLLAYVWVSSFSSPEYPAPMAGLVKDQGAGLCMALLGLGMWAFARVLDRFRGEGDKRDKRGEGDEGDEARAAFDESLYRKPLRIVAIVLSLCAAGRQVVLVWLDPVSAGGLVPAFVLVVAGVGLLLANGALRNFGINLAGILLVELGTLWSQAALFRWGEPFSLVPADRGLSDRWLTMSILGLGLAFLAGRIRRYPRYERPYGPPLRAAAVLTCGWALLGSLVLFASAPLRVDGFLPWSFLALMLCLLPLLESLPGAAEVRGIGVPLLCSPLIVSALASVGLSQWLYFAALAWGYTLWWVSNFALPRFNMRRPQWAVAPEGWPWLGLAAVFFSLAGSSFHWSWSTSLFRLSLAGFEAACAVYLLLMLRNRGWIGFPWLAAFLLHHAGITFCAAWAAPSHSLSFPWPAPPILASPAGCLVGSLVWSNLLLQVVPLWRKHGQNLASRWGWRLNDPTTLTTPFLILPSAVSSLWLSHLLALLTQQLNILPPAWWMAGWTSPLPAASLLTLSFLHVWWLHRAAWESHAVLFSLFCTLLVGWLGLVQYPFHLSLFLALWSVVLLPAYSVWEARKWGGETARPLRQALAMWLAPSLIVAVAGLIFIPEAPLSERLLILTVLIWAAAALGRQRPRHVWLLMALTMVVVLLHGWPLLWVSLSDVTLLMPWYALQTGLLVWCLLWGEERLQRYTEKRTDADERTMAGRTMARHAWLERIRLLFFFSWPSVALLALTEWALHVFFLVAGLSSKGPPKRLAGAGDEAAAILAAVLLLLAGIYRARRSPQAGWVYGLTAFCGAVGVYIRLLWAGLAPTSVWDTAALMGATYILFIIQRLTLSGPLLHVVLVLPLLALLTVPIQLASPHAAATLVSAGVLYVLTHRKADRPLPLYLALLSFNAAVYLWVPGWADSSRMLQVYIIPAAISVLLLLHLHRRELKPGVLNSARLATTGILYAGATLDVFLRGELAVFAVVLALSMGGVIVGIALRIRAFLYSGVTFLVLNILAQLIVLFPEQRLGKAILLLAMGVAITGGMIWFNLQREKILQKVRIFRADLETWR